MAVDWRDGGEQTGEGDDMVAVDVCILDGIENFASKETTDHALYVISRAILCQCHDSADLHTKTLVLLEMLGNYRWDAKVVLILTAFAISYGEFRLILEVYAHSSLAASLATLKKLLMAVVNLTQEGGLRR
ncbi:hypothetical protein L2E82_00664 [Cichorium intybus]|uniref:Uncharacterized protein n=1 Tax=Cichorium intybus TaxID=13427 RepID=A0ACB9GX68_CICIN|nr:hypothetical protein L2E82_00664 [Cichorium intybus]